MIKLKETKFWILLENFGHCSKILDPVGKFWILFENSGQGFENSIFWKTYFRIFDSYKQFYSALVILELLWAVLHNFGRSSKFFNSVQNFPTMSKIFKRCPKFSNSVQNFSTVPKIFQVSNTVQNRSRLFTPSWNCVRVLKIVIWSKTKLSKSCPNLTKTVQNCCKPWKRLTHMLNWP